MSWADIFYPGNPGKRDEVVRLSSKLRTLMEFNFETTNKLIKMLNENCHPSPPLTKVKIDYTATIKANSEKLIAKMAEVQGVAENIDKKLASELDPEIYKKLKLPDTSFKERIALAKKVALTGLGIPGTAANVAMVTAINSGAILSGIVDAIGVVSSCLLATLALQVLIMGLDMIASAIIGAVEKNKLEDAIDQLEKVMKEFEPASKEYTKTIMRIQMRLEDEEE